MKFSKLMRTLEGKENNVEVTQAAPIVEKPKSKEKKSIYRSTIANNPIIEEPHLTENDRKIDHSYDEVIHTEKLIDIEQIDLRKAIIYSEIFTRPQY